MGLLLSLSVNTLRIYRAAADPPEQLQVATVKFHSAKHQTAFSVKGVLELATRSLEICCKLQHYNFLRVTKSWLVQQHTYTHV